MAKITETETKEQKGRKHIANFLSAMNFHDDDPETTIKLMRQKLVEINQRKESASASAVVVQKPATSRKIVIKFCGSKTPVVLQKRPHSETLVSGNDDIETDSRNASRPAHFKTLMCKRQKIKNNNGDESNDEDGETQLIDSSTKVYPQNPLMISKNMEGVNDVKDFITSVGGSEIELVIEKRLTLSDVTQNQGRLLIPVLQVKNQGLLTVDEKIKLGRKEDISVLVFDPKRRKWTLNLTKWKMSKEYYVLKTNWNNVVNTNGLKEGVVIRVLSFRVCQQLCFALERVA